MTIDHQAQLRVHIRWMIRRDMAEVLEIERGAFEFPWFEEEFIRCLRQRNCIGVAAPNVSLASYLRAAQNAAPHSELRGRVMSVAATSARMMRSQSVSSPVSHADFARSAKPTRLHGFLPLQRL